ncbi:MAG: cytidine deaminase [Gemmatimonadetes bacterium]|nr:cytidine deaminase [Gemmatimonadota bacterium]
MAGIDRLNDDELIKEALRVLGNAYAPYSRFPVGAVVETEVGVFEGVNVENASYGLTICAERIAIGAAVTAGAREVRTVAVASTSSPPASPCGACRQVIAEFGGGARVLLVNQRGERVETSIEALLPDSFSFDPPPAREGGRS